MKLININQNLNFYQNDDITIEFILLDDNSDIITELGDYTFLVEIEEQLSMDNDYFSTIMGLRSILVSEIITGDSNEELFGSPENPFDAGSQGYLYASDSTTNKTYYGEFGRGVKDISIGNITNHPGNEIGETSAFSGNYMSTVMFYSLNHSSDYICGQDTTNGLCTDNNQNDRVWIYDTGWLIHVRTTWTR